MLSKLVNGLKWLVYVFILIRSYIAGRDSERAKSYERQEHARIHSRKIHDRNINDSDFERLRQKYSK